MVLKWFWGGLRIVLVGLVLFDLGLKIKKWLGWFATCAGWVCWTV